MNDPASKAVDQALHVLGEHFEAVQILATRCIEGNTHTCCRGTGNYHSRIGLAHEFLNAEVAKEHAVQLSEIVKPSE